MPTNGRLVFLPDETKPNREGVLEDDESLLGIQAEGLGVTAVTILSCPRLMVQLLCYSVLSFRPERTDWRRLCSQLRVERASCHKKRQHDGVTATARMLPVSQYARI
jgi:hypothetical protein